MILFQSKLERKSSKIYKPEDVGSAFEQPQLIKTRKTGVWSEEETKSSK